MNLPTVVSEKIHNLCKILHKLCNFSYTTVGRFMCFTVLCNCLNSGLTVHEGIGGYSPSVWMICLSPCSCNHKLTKSCLFGFFFFVLFCFCFCFCFCFVLFFFPFIFPQMHFTRSMLPQQKIWCTCNHWVLGDWELSSLHLNMKAFTPSNAALVSHNGLLYISRANSNSQVRQSRVDDFSTNNIL